MARLTFEVTDLVVAIIKRIKELDISDAEAARRLNVSPQRLNGWKRGSSINLDGKLQEDICRFLNESPARVVEMLGLSVSSAEMPDYLITAA